MDQKISLNSSWFASYAHGMIFILSFSLLNSCGFKTKSTGSHLSGKISGVVTLFVGFISQSYNHYELINIANAQACPTPVYVKLFQLEDDGQIDESSPKAIELLSADALYSFDLEKLQLPTKNSKIDYLVKAEGCNNDIYKRPITDFNSDQDINANTTVIADVVNVNDLIVNKLNDVDRIEVENLIKSLDAVKSGSAINKLITSTSASAKFIKIFGSSPTVIKDPRPEVIVDIPSLSINELANTSFRINGFHIDPNYSFAYKWKLDGVAVSSQHFFNYMPSANASGIHQLDLYVGKDDGAGNIDLNIPYYTKSYVLTVQNNILPTAPDIIINNATPSPRTTNNVQIDISTGVALANCSNFSRLAFSETSAVPGIMQFNIECTDAGTQTETVNFTNIDGVKNIYVWAIDREGNVSSPKNINLILDTVNPTANLSLASSMIKGGSINAVNLNASDSASGLQSLELFYSSDSVTYASLATLNVNSTTHNWTAPLSNITSAKLKLVVTDHAGFVTTVYSPTLTIDSSAPSAPFLSAATPDTTSLTVISATIANCTDIGQILLTENNIQPTGLELGWQYRSDSKFYCSDFRSNTSKSITRFKPR